MSSSQSNRKGQLGRTSNRKKRTGRSNQTLKNNPKNINVGKDASNEKNTSGGKDVSKGGFTKSGQKGTGCRSRTRRRKKQIDATQTHEESQKPDNDVNHQTRRKQRRRRRNRKRKVSPVNSNIMSLESSSSVSHAPSPHVKSLGNQKVYPNSSNSSNVSPMEYDNLPWANLNVPMSLTFFEFEVTDQGVDFDRQARENHLRWLANLEKERNINIKNARK